MQPVVTVLLLEAYRLTMIEILLTAHGVVFSETDYSVGDSVIRLQ